MSTHYEPEMWTLRKDDIYAAHEALRAGIEHTRGALIEHDANLGRTTAKNKWWAETMEQDILKMETALANLHRPAP